MQSVGSAKLARRALALAIASSLLAGTPAFAAPFTERTPADTSSEIGVQTDSSTEQFRAQLSAKQKQLDEFTAQLDALDRELEIASEQYNAAVSRLAEVKARVAVVQSDLVNANQAYALQSAVLDKRASTIYKDGELSAVEVLLNAKSVGDLVTRVKFLNTVGIRDADIAASLQGQKELLEKQAADLRAAEQEAVSLEFEARTRKSEIQNRILERQQMMAQTQTELLAMLDSEASRRTGEESKLLAEVLSGANAKGIIVAPGSPVETALAYHGVPYLWAGATPRAFDCSGLVLYVFKQHGVTLPHYSGSQFLQGEKVASSDLQANDVVFFGSPIHHVGIYIGGGYYIHAPRTGDFVKISKLADRSDFAGARRYDWQPRVGAPLNAKKSTTAALSGVSH